MQYIVSFHWLCTLRILRSPCEMTDLISPFLILFDVIVTPPPASELRKSCGSHNEKIRLSAMFVIFCGVIHSCGFVSTTRSEAALRSNMRVCDASRAVSVVGNCSVFSTRWFGKWVVIHVIAYTRSWSSVTEWEMYKTPRVYPPPKWPILCRVDPSTHCYPAFRLLS